MKNKIRLAVGWFGVLTPVYAAGVLTVLLSLGIIEASLISRIVIVSAINCFIGYRILRVKIKIVEPGVKKKHAKATREGE